MGVVLGVIVAIVVGWLIAVYNRLVALKNRVANAYAQIDVQLKRRHDLIPNLLEIARKYMSHERETFEAIVAARNRAIEAQGAAARDPTDRNAIHSVAAAETVLGGALGRLFALSENYPELKASTNMAQFAEELTSTENKVTFARQAFNDAVMALNTAIQAFPAVLFAGALGFKAAGMLEAVEAPQERAAPVVKF
jgi:LemA protein